MWGWHWAEALESSKGKGGAEGIAQRVSRVPFLILRDTQIVKMILCKCEW